MSSLKIIRLEPVLLRNLSALRLPAESLSVTAYCSLEPEADEPGLQRSDNKTFPGLVTALQSLSKTRG